jgi:VWFA-related protein
MLAHWHPRSALLVLFVLTCASAADDSSGSSGAPTYHSSVSEVRLTVFATNENSRPVETLTKSDFVVVDNGFIIRNFRSFTRSDETSLDVVALVDVSESVAPRFRTALRDVLHLVARGQSIPDDNIAVLSFSGTRPVILCSSSCRASDSVSRLQALQSSGATPLFDALTFAAGFISHRHRAGTRPVLVLFSDGNDTISMHSPNEALEAVLATGALIYSVDIAASGSGSLGSIFLRQVSEATGGRYFLLQDGAAAVLNAALEDLHASYVVTYDLPSHQPGFHSLRVLPTHNLNLTFHSRNGYYYEPSDR